MKQIEDTYKGQVYIVWKNLPLTSIHKNAMGAAIASEAAHKQGKFWEFHDKLFANQSKLELDNLKQYAKDIGLDTAQFEKDLADPGTKKRVDVDVSEAGSFGVTGTPSFFVNGHFLNGAQPFEGFAKIINAELQRLNIPVPPAPSGK